MLQKEIIGPTLVYPFHPRVFEVDSSLSLGTFSVVNMDVSQNLKHRMANSVDPNEIVHTSHLIWIYTVCIRIYFASRTERAKLQLAEGNQQSRMLFANKNIALPQSSEIKICF